MHRSPEQRGLRIRLLERWLPMAQAESTRHAWQFTSTELETLIIRAAPALQAASNPLAARAILWHYSRLLVQEHP